MISAQTCDLEHVYPTGIKALDGVNFVAEAGEFVAVLGPNGSGKTTLLKHFVALLKPGSGKVLLGDSDVSALSPDRLRADVGFVFQDPNDQLFAATVADDVAFGPRNLGLTAPLVLERVTAAVGLVGAAGLEARPIHSLSYGQKRRVALAGVLAMSPKMIVLDEPTAGLDPMGATRIMALLHRINQEQGVTVIVATHDIDLVPAYADRVYLMRDGRIVVSGAPPAVLSQIDLLHQSELRMPRAARALQLFGDELGHSIVDVPLTMEQHYNCGQDDGRDDACNGQSKARRRGFTTGVAAAAAARAAAELLVYGRRRNEVELRSPLGSIVKVPIADVLLVDGGNAALATVVKQGVSPDDVIDGAEICSFVTLSEEPGISIDGGPGVGRVSRPGLALGMGQAAINPVPRQMIADALSLMLQTERGLKAIISAPRGEELARRTNNARMGIVGGIAILGTSLESEATWPSRHDIFEVVSVDPAQTDKTAVLLVGHGSRAEGANDGIYEVVAFIRRETGYKIVEVGFMQLCAPTIEASMEVCIEQGATRIIILPYFLHLGVHMKQDLPLLTEELRNQHPEVEVIFGKHIGFHPKLAEIVIQRIAESSANGSGVRDGG
ncbi:MAG: cobalt-precorrin-5B (C(1))-methyltransferase [Chloroflexi bacterium]|nr:cobalt-precorrin-5B (C(1))-methyltransferase [Chloroflexota bacterium]